MHVGFWWGNPRERDHLEEDSIKMDLTEWDGEAYTGLNWLRIGTGGGRLRMRY